MRGEHNPAACRSAQEILLRRHYDAMQISEEDLEAADLEAALGPRATRARAGSGPGGGRTRRGPGAGDGGAGAAQRDGCPPTAVGAGGRGGGGLPTVVLRRTLRTQASPPRGAATANVSFLSRAPSGGGSLPSVRASRTAAPSWASTARPLGVGYLESGWPASSSGGGGSGGGGARQRSVVGFKEGGAGPRPQRRSAIGRALDAGAAAAEGADTAVALAASQVGAVWGSRRRARTLRAARNSGACLCRPGPAQRPLF
jgi:hypothetical protein